MINHINSLVIKSFIKLFVLKKNKNQDNQNNNNQVLIKECITIIL